MDEWKGFCPSCEGDGRLVLIERGPRWTARELFSRTWEPRQHFTVHCRTCGTAQPVSRTELTAASSPRSSAPARAVSAVPRPRPAAAAVPAPRSAPDTAAPAKAGAAH